MAVLDVIKFEGNPDTFAWKHPNSELATWSQLIVHESQEAILFKGGQALDLFGPGRHTLDTANIPLLNKVINLPFGGKSPFSAEIWFINKGHSLDIKWGTPTPMQLQDPKFGVFVPVRAYGQFGIRINDSRTFLTKIVTTLPSFSKTDLTDFFKSMYLHHVKDDISTYIVQKGVSVLEINSFITVLSKELKEQIEPAFEEYGIELVNFYINDISVPDDDSSVIKLKEILEERAAMNITGYTYSQGRSFDVLESSASNTGTAGSIMGAGIGLGMGAGVGDAFRNQMSQSSSVMSQTDLHGHPTENRCKSCGIDNKVGMKYCHSCGNKLGDDCPHCGAAVALGQKFCSDCGKSLASKCSNCDHKLEPGERFCSNCGKKAGE